MKDLYDSVSSRCSKAVTQSYSTSFSLGIRLLHKRFRKHIYAIYGFVRFADEIVDTFHNHNKRALLDRFCKDTWLAIKTGISLNPILHSFQQTVNSCGICRNLIESFLQSMAMDIEKRRYDKEQFSKYVHGSAEVVGLMCLKVFCEEDERMYKTMKPHAMSLGAAFQKINFLRDINTDCFRMGRCYFPGVDVNNFNENSKNEIEVEIERDFRHGYEGVRNLPKSSRFGVYVAYVYYHSLFNKISNLTFSQVLNQRIRISNRKKYSLLVQSYLKHCFNLL